MMWEMYFIPEKRDQETERGAWEGPWEGTETQREGDRLKRGEETQKEGGRESRGSEAGRHHLCWDTAVKVSSSHPTSPTSCLTTTPLLKTPTRRSAWWMASQPA